MKVIEALSGKKSGLTRDEIITKGKLENNGQLSRILEDLIECGFVRKYCHTDKKLKFLTKTYPSKQLSETLIFI